MPGSATQDLGTILSQFPQFTVRVMPWIRLKILCFLLMYLIVFLVLLSFPVKKVSSLATCISTGWSMVMFGGTLLLAGISTLKTALWRSAAELLKNGITDASEKTFKLIIAGQSGQWLMGGAYAVIGAMFIITGINAMKAFLPEFLAMEFTRSSVLAVIIVPPLAGVVIRSICLSEIK